MPSHSLFGLINYANSCILLFSCSATWNNSLFQLHFEYNLQSEQDSLQFHIPAMLFISTDIRYDRSSLNDVHFKQSFDIVLLAVGKLRWSATKLQCRSVFVMMENHVQWCVDYLCNHLWETVTNTDKRDSNSKEHSEKI